LTIRQRIIQILKEGGGTIREISQLMGIKEKEVVEHLPYVQRSVGKDKPLIVEPARCFSCDYVFKDRTRFATPSRCPVCRSTHILPALLGIDIE
jgi:predicted Zn-ribbon and HTH transcriptional regulator